MLRASDEGAVEREAHIACLQQLDDFVFLAFVFQGEFVLIVEGGLGVLVDVEIDFVADFCNHIELHIRLKDEVVVAFATLAHRRVVVVVVLEAEGHVDGTLRADVDGVAAEDGFEGLAADEHGRDDGRAIGGRARVLAAAFLPIFLNTLTVLIFKIFALR